MKTMDEVQRKEWWRRQLYGFTAPDAVVSVDSNVRKVIAAMEPGAENRIHVIPNFVDTKIFTPVEKTWEETRILYPRRLTLLRGCNDFIKASQNYPEYSYLAVGQAADEAMEQQAVAWGNSTPHLRFIHKPMDEMAEVYQSSDISVIPTKAAEGLSLSLLESMACGLPIVTTPVGGIGDAIIDRYNALVYDPNHDDLGQYIDYLAKNPEMMEVFGKRNRQIACECFDIEIWKSRWRKLLQQFDKTPRLGGIKKEIKPKSKSKLTAMMVVKNESDRYLRRVIENTLLFADNVAILDDHSTDDTYKLLLHMCAKQEFEDRMFIRKAHDDETWDNESNLRNQLMRFAMVQTSPDWLIAVDADELYEVGMAEEVQRIMSQNQADWAGFRFYDFWNDEEYYRDDDMFPAGYGYAPRMFRVGAVKEYLWPDKKRHCGSIPENILQQPGLNSDIRVKHLGYVKSTDRLDKYIAKTKDDPNNEFYPQEVYEAILDEPILCDDLILVKWDAVNPWQTGKKTIAYPPGMHWGIMQQRPHHLLKLMASERNRVFFGDDMAPGMMEVAPYLTLVKDWQNCPHVKDVDILYITHPHQIDYCKDIKYKTLVYDCVDWNEDDGDLICKADYILCASELLHDSMAGLSYAYYVPNACDFDLFNKTADPTDDIVGYMGIVNSILNPDIINALSKKWPCLVMGENKDIVKNTNRNINITGHIPYQQLPAMLQQCKVGIIPFRTDNDYIRYSAPIKVWDYLSAGRPVVATCIPELQPLADLGLIRLVDDADYEGWVEAVGRAMTEYPNEKGREYVKAHTWANRYEQIKGALGW